jgi:hypothetical protein
MSLADVGLNAGVTGITVEVASVGLHTGDPGAAGDQNEVSGNNYSRVSITSQFGSASGGVILNDEVIQFPTPSGSWGTVSWASFWASGPTFLGRQELTTPRAVGLNTDVKFPIGDLSFTVANPA